MRKGEGHIFGNKIASNWYDRIYTRELDMYSLAILEIFHK